MGKNYLYDILKTIEQKKEELEALQKKLKIESKGKIRRFFSADTYEKQQFKIYRTEIKGQIKSNKNSIKGAQNYLNKVCTFDFDIVVQFLADVLSIIEEEQYETINIELENGITTIIPIGSVIVPIRNTFDEDVCLISTSQNIREISELYDNEYIDDIDDIENSIENGKFILLELNDKYCLFDYSRQQVPKEIIENYPYLRKIISDLINIKLSNPDLTDSQAASIIIQEIPKRYSHLIGNSKRFFSLTKNYKK